MTDNQAKTFFLGDQHELSRSEKDGGGGVPKYAPINWQNKSATLHEALTRTKRSLDQAADPLSGQRYFLAALPEPTVKKESTNSRRAPTGTLDERTQYSGEHSRVFRRLGLDLLSVDETGTAIVHASSHRLDQLMATSGALVRAGVAEQARWATLMGFEPIAERGRVDLDWLNSLQGSDSERIIIELQPLLTMVEADEVMRAILGKLNRAKLEALTGSGTDFSGRQWFRGNLSKQAILSLAQSFYSIQSLHAPLSTEVIAVPGSVPVAQAVFPIPPTGVFTNLPVVAVVDTGVPIGNQVLAPLRRGTYLLPSSAGGTGAHASRVASCVVFGNIIGPGPLPPPTCRFFDVNIAEGPSQIDEKAVVTAMEAVVSTAPEVRVFNCSFGEYAPLNAFGTVGKRERLIAMRDLDNFIFARDVLVVVAAGNSPKNLLPTSPYPDHLDDENWQLGAWSMGYNTLTCGSFVGTLSPEGLTGTIGLPSPFTRVGPGIAGAPVPEFAAPGGDSTNQYAVAPNSGVWVVNSNGRFENAIGTSIAAPLLAREAAFAFELLQRVCADGARPFAVTVKAFLALVSKRAELPSRFRPLAERTLGRGTTSADRLRSPSHDSAVFVWQGILESSKDVATIQVPVPKEWLQAADSPRLRIVCSWDPPVNDAVSDLWACRRVAVKVRPLADGKAMRASNKAKHKSHPLIDRIFDVNLQKVTDLNNAEPDDVWFIELSYEEIADSHPSMDFSPQQRVGLAIELLDVSDAPVSPQEMVQRIPIAQTMVNLGSVSVAIQAPVRIRAR